MDSPVIVLLGGPVLESGDNFRPKFFEAASSSGCGAVVVDRGVSDADNMRTLVIVPCERLWKYIGWWAKFEAFWQLRKVLGSNLTYVSGVQKSSDILEEYNRLVLRAPSAQPINFSELWLTLIKISGLGFAS